MFPVIDKIKTIKNLDIKNKKLLIRLDLNIPILDGKILSYKRIIDSIETIKYALNNGAKVIILSHLGRPNPNNDKLENQIYSLRQLLSYLEQLLNTKIVFLDNWIDGIDTSLSDVFLCENVRFNKGEIENDSNLSQKMAALCDIFVMDAFATSHRKEASTCGIIKYAKEACIGLLFEKEINALSKIIHAQKKPVVAIIGGSKVSTKSKMIKNILNIADEILLGGGMANTYLKAINKNIGKSLYESSMIDDAIKTLELATKKNVKIKLPVDYLVCNDSINSVKKEIRVANDKMIEEYESICDIGPETIKLYSKSINNAQTVFWNGPLGIFEIEAFSVGSKTICQNIANNINTTILGGGDTVAVVDSLNMKYDSFTHASTAGGAFLCILEGESLPCLLEEKMLVDKNISNLNDFIG